MTKPVQPKKVRDIAILGAPTEDGRGAQLLRVREGQVSTGELRPVKEGQPITGSEVVRLHPLDESKRICEVEVLHAPASEKRTEQAGTTLARPARIATKSYRKNWSTIFEAKRKKRPGNDWSVN